VLCMCSMLVMSGCVSSHCATEDCEAPNRPTKVAKPSATKPVEQPSSSAAETAKAPSIKNTLGKSHVEPLNDAQIQADLIIATVKSTGCTRPQHFSVNQKVVDGVCELTIVRTKADYCRMLPMPATIKLSWENTQSCDVDKTVLTNPDWDGVIGKSSQKVLK